MLAVAPSREILLQIAQQLPASAQVLSQLGELLMDVNSGLDHVARLLRRDSALATRVIRISNSIVYGASGGVSTIEEAVNRVGYSEIYRLVGLASAAQLIEHHLSHYGIAGAQLRDNTLMTAFAAESLATRCGQDPRVCYTAGLLRSTGKLVLDRYAKRSGKPDTFPGFGIPSYVAWEKATVGLTNPEAAEAVLTAWRFPAEIVRPIRHHLDAGAQPDSAGVVGILLHVACAAAQDQGYGLPGEHTHWDVTPAALRLLGLQPAAVKEAAEEAAESYDSIKGSL